MFKLFKNFNKKDLLYLIFVFLFVIVQVYLDLKMPDYMKEITRLVETSGSKMQDILVNGLYMLLCAFGSLVSAIIVGYLSANVGASLSRTIRRKVYTKVESFAIAEIKKFKTSSLITRTTNDITQIQMLVSMGMQLMIKAPITAIWAITKILNKNFTWSMITGLSVLILLMLISIMFIFVVPKFKIVQKLTDKLNNATRESLTGIRVIRAFNAKDFQKSKFESVNTELTNTHLFIQRMFSFMSPMMFLVMNFLTLSIYFLGAMFIRDALMVDKLSIFSDMVVFSSYAMQVIMSFLMLAMIFMMLPRAQVSASRINEVLETKESIVDGDDNFKTNDEGVVEFVNVSFKYPDAEEYLLKDISFKANKGETVAFIGSTGSGKSTLINLIPRFYDVSSGSVLVDNVDVRKYKQSTLRNKISYISQKASMFNGSVSYNVKYGNNGKKEVSDDEVWQALEIAQAKDFVLKMEDKCSSHIAEGGTNLSGGQKQRISIARAIARKPEIYIFDDSFSALDYKTDASLRNALKSHDNATTLIVAQRIGTIINADKIIVLDKGKIVGVGKHRELLKNCKVYKEIAKSQLSKEELDNA